MYYNRLLLSKISKFLDKNINILFLGSRQAGKTVMMKLIQQELIARNLAKQEQTLFFDLEKGSDLKILSNKEPEQFVDYLYTRTAQPKNVSLFIFIDEIQYLPLASSFIKVLSDHFPQLRLFLSGSSSLEVKKIFTDRLTGRKISFNVNTLNFKEYLIFQQHSLASAWQKISLEKILKGDIEQLKSYQDFISEILPVFEDFVLHGGYPRPSLLENKSIRNELLAEIRDQYARRDVRDILNIENIAGFNRLLGILATQIGNLINIDELASSANLSRQTVEKYIFLLEETFIIKIVLPYFKNSRQELIKMPKIYFADTGLRNLLIEQLAMQNLDLRLDKGALVENALMHQLQILDWPIRFWRTKIKTEVDFIITAPNGGNIPIEVKYQPISKPNIPSGIISFIKKYQPPYAIVATKDYFGKSVFQSTLIYFVPVMFF